MLVYSFDLAISIELTAIVCTIPMILQKEDSFINRVFLLEIICYELILFAFGLWSIALGSLLG